MHRKMCQKKENFNLKIIKTVQKELKLKIKQTIQKKNQIDGYSVKEDHKEFIKTNKLTVKIQQRFRSEKQNVFTKEINEITQNSNNDKKI